MSSHTHTRTLPDPVWQRRHWGWLRTGRLRDRSSSLSWARFLYSPHRPDRFRGSHRWEGRMDRQETDTDGQTDRETDIQDTDRRTDRQAGRPHRQTDRQADRQTDNVLTGRGVILFYECSMTMHWFNFSYCLYLSVQISHLHNGVT
jgi:hypothetical protein